NSISDSVLISPSDNSTRYRSNSSPRSGLGKTSTIVPTRPVVFSSTNRTRAPLLKRGIIVLQYSQCRSNNVLFTARVSDEGLHKRLSPLDRRGNRRQRA